MCVCLCVYMNIVIARHVCLYMCIRVYKLRVFIRIYILILYIYIYIYNIYIYIYIYTSRTRPGVARFLNICLLSIIY